MNIFDIKFTQNLYKHQQQALDWMCYTDDEINRDKLKGYIIALDMGLGKTALFIYTTIQNKFNKTLIVVPKTILTQFKTEFNKFTNIKEEDNDTIYTFYGKHNTTNNNANKIEINRATFVITTYDTFANNCTKKDNLINTVQFDAICFDEAHKLRNKTNIYLNTQLFIKNNTNIKKIYLLTGTVIHTNTNDFTNLVNLFDWNHETNIEKLMEKYYLRITKEQIKQKLPEKIHHTEHIDLHDKQKDTINDLRNDIINLKDIKTKNSKIMVLQKIAKIRNACNYIQDDEGKIHSTKFDHTIDYIKKQKNITNNNRFIIFSQWTKTLITLQKILHEQKFTTQIYDGKSTTTQKSNKINDFKLNKFDILLITIQSGGIGINLNFTNQTIMIDNWWTDAATKQAFDRTRRLGQIYDKCYYLSFIAKNTIEEWIQNIHENRKNTNLPFDIQNFDIDKNTYKQNIIDCQNNIKYKETKEILHNFIGNTSNDSQEEEEVEEELHAQVEQPDLITS
jgi:SNF2 family DNA or RNA helicase